MDKNRCNVCVIAEIDNLQNMKHDALDYTVSKSRNVTHEFA